MAYAAGDLLITVRGNLDPAEIWTNTWAFKVAGGDPDFVQVVDALNVFYGALASEWLPTEFSAVGATVKALDTGVSQEGTWTPITGLNEQDILPTQLAIRVSLSASGGHQGGPFLAGWSKQASSEDGVVDAGVVTDIIDAIGVLDASVQAADFVIGIHRPTTSTVVQATQARVGQRFDVIRKRSNNNAEAYASTLLG